jgi:triphosphoribosyl-dephospho-CoA synthase
MARDAPGADDPQVALIRAREAYLRACALDVQVRKPGNVSQHSAGHRMHAAQFLASARASVDALFQLEARVGQRIEAAVRATWAAVGCNTNLGILLLCAPLAAAREMRPGADTPEALRAATTEVLRGLDVADAEAAYRAIAMANPGGLASVAEQDVREPPLVSLSAAMALAADRDRIAREYRDGFPLVFEVGLPALRGLSLSHPPDTATYAATETATDAATDAATTAAVQRCFLALLAEVPDTHLLRKHGAAAADAVMGEARHWHARAEAREPLDADPGFVAWDEALKARGLNPGTTADLTVACLLVAGLVAPR